MDLGLGKSFGVPPRCEEVMQLQVQCRTLARILLMEEVQTLRL